MTSNSGILDEIREEIHQRVLKMHRKGKPQDLTDEIMHAIEAVLNRHGQSNTLVRTENAHIYVENGRLHIDAWDTDFNVNISHSEFGAGRLHVGIRIAKEDYEKILELIKAQTVRTLLNPRAQ